MIACFLFCLLFSSHNSEKDFHILQNLKGLICTSSMPPKKFSLSAALKVTEPLSEEDLLKLVVRGLGSAARPILDDWGYNGGAAAFLGLALDNTNLLVQYGNVGPAV